MVGRIFGFYLDLFVREPILFVILLPLLPVVLIGAALIAVLKS